MNALYFLAPVFALAALCYVAGKSGSIKKSDPGTDRMKEI